jgi:hypothetical protein
LALVLLALEHAMHSTLPAMVRPRRACPIQDLGSYGGSEVAGFKPTVVMSSPPLLHCPHQQLAPSEAAHCTFPEGRSFTGVVTSLLFKHFQPSSRRVGVPAQAQKQKSLALLLSPGS